MPCGEHPVDAIPLCRAPLSPSSPRSATVGILMNTRGLVEIIALNVGLQLGILSTELFTLGRARVCGGGEGKGGISALVV